MSDRNRDGDKIIETSMSRFFLNMGGAAGFVEDEEGIECADLPAARAAATEGLRDTLAGDLQEGTLNMASFIEIEDEDHQLLETVTFASAVEITNDLPKRPSNNQDQ